MCGRRSPMAAPKLAMVAGVERGHVLLVVELEQRVADAARSAPAAAQRSSSSITRSGSGAPSLPRRWRRAQRRGVGGADRAGAGRLALERQVVQHGHAVVAVDHEIDLDAGAERACLRGCGARVNTGSAARRRARCHLSQVRWPSRSTKIGIGHVRLADDRARCRDRRRRARARGRRPGPREVVRIGDHRLEADAVGEVQVDHGVRAVVGDAVDAGLPGLGRRAIASASGRTASVAGPSLTGSGTAKPAWVKRAVRRPCPSIRFIVPMKPATNGVSRLAIDHVRRGRSARSCRRASRRCGRPSPAPRPARG